MAAVLFPVGGCAMGQGSIAPPAAGEAAGARAEPSPTPLVARSVEDGNPRHDRAAIETRERDVVTTREHVDLARRRAEQLARERAAAEAARRRAETRKVQEVLTAYGYYAGPVDGEAGPATAAAVMAFQKVQGLSRDGVIGPQTLSAISAPEPPPLRGGASTRIEVDLDRQVVHLIVGGERVRTMNASSGNGEVYTWPDGRVARADTPVGTFSIYRRVNGLRDGDLGAMFDPLYFHQGWAIHGSNHVPGYAASHGCVRLPRADASWLAGQVPNGTQVVVHGSTNAFDPRTETVWIN